jgi:hypothetical protein
LVAAARRRCLSRGSRGGGPSGRSVSSAALSGLLQAIACDFHPAHTPGSKGGSGSMPPLCRHCRCGRGRRRISSRGARADPPRLGHAGPGPGRGSAGGCQGLSPACTGPAVAASAALVPYPFGLFLAQLLHRGPDRAGPGAGAVAGRAGRRRTTRGRWAGGWGRRRWTGSPPWAALAAPPSGSTTAARERAVCRAGPAAIIDSESPPLWRHTLSHGPHGDLNHLTP